MNQTSTQAKKIKPLRTPLPIEEHLNLLRPFILTPDLISRVSLWLISCSTSLCRPSILFSLQFNWLPREMLSMVNNVPPPSREPLNRFAIYFYPSTLSNSHSLNWNFIDCKLMECLNFVPEDVQLRNKRANISFQNGFLDKNWLNFL